jgi:hypothetical protein
MEPEMIRFEESVHDAPSSVLKSSTSSLLDIIVLKLYVDSFILAFRKLLKAILAM